MPSDTEAQKRGRSRAFDHFTDALNHTDGWERVRDQVAEAFGVAARRNRRRVPFVDYATQFARRADGEQETARSRTTHPREWGKRLERLQYHVVKVPLKEAERSRRDGR